MTTTLRPTDIEDALRHERSIIVVSLLGLAIEHEHAAEESKRNDERDDEWAHKIEAQAYRRAVSVIRARSMPPVKREPDEAEIDDEIVF